MDWTLWGWLVGASVAYLAFLCVIGHRKEKRRNQEKETRRFHFPAPRVAVLDESPDPYRDFVLEECIATGQMVWGGRCDNGDLQLHYENGDKRRIPKAEL